MTSPPSPTEFDLDVRAYVYDHTLRHGQPPASQQAAAALSAPADEVHAAFRRLAEGRVLVLQRDNGEILMANPFSAVPTPFLVQAGDRAWYGNCIWDALGILAMVGQDGTVQTSCGCCGTAMTIEVRAGAARPEQWGVAHFAIPAARWWEDIVFN